MWPERYLLVRPRRRRLSAICHGVRPAPGETSRMPAWPPCGTPRPASTWDAATARLDEVDNDVEEELKLLAPLSPGHTLATGSYSARIQRELGSALTVVQNPGQLVYGLRPTSDRALLLMLHGSEQDFQNAMVVEEHVLNYRKRRAVFTRKLSKLLHERWIVLGADKRTDTTFHMLMSDVCDDVGPSQRPIFVVDPRPEHEVAHDWPREALRHVRMTPREFLSLARSPSDDA